MRELVENLPAYMMVGIIVIVVVSQINRLVGAIIGLVFWAAVAYVGRQAYAAGDAIGLPGIPFSEVVFYGFCAVFAALNVVFGWSALRKKRKTSFDSD